MSMSKKDFIAIADAIRDAYVQADMRAGETGVAMRSGVCFAAEFIAYACKKANPHFMGDRWLAYIAGECGPNGGIVKEPKTLKGKVNAKMRKLADAVSHIS